MNCRIISQIPLKEQVPKVKGSKPDSLSYMPGLDGLRALAVLAVIAYHLDLAWAPGGLLGVCVFFVLSGYLITSILLRQWESTGSINFKDFWLRRARRLLPALFVMLGGVLAWAAFWAPDRLPSLGWEALAALFYSSNWRQIFHQVSYFESFGPLSPLGHLWSLAVEGQFYLFWPLLLGLGLRYLPRRSLLVGGTVAIALISALVMALLYVPGLDPSRIYYGTDTRAFALLIGAVLALVWPSNRLSAALSGTKRLTLDLAGGAGLLIILIMMVKTNEYQTFLYQGGLLLFSIAAAVVVAVLAHPASRLGKVFALQPLRWLGACSYGIYLWHYPVIVLTNPVVNTGGTDILRSLAQIAISVALAALSFYFIEEPIRRGRWKISGQKQLEPGWRWKSLVVTGKIALVSISMVLSVFCLTVYGSMQLYQDTGSLPAQEQVGEVGAIGQIPQSGQDKMQDRSSPEVISENNPEAKPDISSGAKPEMSPEAKPEMPTQTKPEIPQENPEGPPATNPEPNQEDSVAEKKEYTGQGLTLIGDSVMLNLKPILEERLPGIVIDAKVGRQMYEAIDVITELQAQGKVGKIVIIGLGTNGSFTAEQLTKTLDSLQGVEQIVLLNSRVPRPWQDVVNQTLAEVAKTYPRTKLVDWFTASKGHNEYFYKDGVHLNPTGAEAYAELLIREISLWVQL